jgi:hypothetical protein
MDKRPVVLLVVVVLLLGALTLTARGGRRPAPPPPPADLPSPTGGHGLSGLPPVPAPPNPEEPVAVPGVTMHGHVVDGCGWPVAGATVSLRDDGLESQSQQTGRAGAFTLREVPAGYGPEIVARAPGCFPSMRGTHDLDPRDTVIRLLPGARLSGHVLATEGRRPVAEALVSVRDGPATVTTRSGPDGSFEFEAVPIGEFVDVSAEAGVDGWVWMPEIRLADGVPLELLLPPVHTLTGRVVRDSGGTRVPVKGVRIEFVVGIGRVSIFGPCADGVRAEGPGAVSGPDGSFVLHGLTRWGSIEVTSPEWRVAGEKSGGEPDRRGVLVVVEPRPPEAPARPLPPAPRTWFTGVVRDEMGAPVAGARVVAAPVGGSAWTDGAGRFHVLAETGALSRIEVTAPGFGMERRDGPPEPAPGTCDVGEFVLARRAVREGRVVTADGVPIPGASVRGVPVAPDGSFRVEVPREADYELYTEAPGFACLVLRRADLPPEGPLTVVLAPRHVREGIVLDLDGLPVTGVRLDYLPGDGPPTKSDHAGRFRLECDGSGEVRILASAEGLLFPEWVTVPPGEDEIVLRARVPRHLAGRVIDGDGQPVGGAEVLIRGDREAKAVTSDDGRFRADDLVGERFSVCVTAPDESLSVRPREGVPADTGDLLFLAESALTLAGTVVFEDGRPAAGAVAYADPKGHLAECGSANCAEDGSFEIAGLLPGTWVIEVWDGDDDEWTASCEVEVPARGPVRLVLSPSPAEEEGGDDD